jgi:hypothetical protein
MAAFINMYLSGKRSWRNTGRHLLFGAAWTLFTGIYLLRLDVLFFGGDNNHLLRLIFPLTLCVFFVVALVKQKWYYTLALLFYPLLILGWFLPKWILKVGKFYALIHYVNFIFKRLKNFKRTLIRGAAIGVVTLLFIFVENDFIRIMAVLTCTWAFFSSLSHYIRNSFRPIMLFDTPLDGPSSVDPESNSNSSLVKALEEIKDDEKLDASANTMRKMERFVLVNYGLGYLSKRLTTFKGKRAYTLFSIFQFSFYFLGGVCFFSFVNYELFKITPASFAWSTEPGRFDFIYYTLKNISFSEPDYLRPNSILTKVVEITAFLTFSFVLLLIVASHLLSLRSQKADEALQLAVVNFERHNRAIEVHVRERYQMEVKQAAMEIASIKKSIQNLSRFLERIV